MRSVPAPVRYRSRSPAPHTCRRAAGDGSKGWRFPRTGQKLDRHHGCHQGFYGPDEAVVAVVGFPEIGERDFKAPVFRRKIRAKGVTQLHRKRDGNARQLRSSHELADPVSPNAPDTTGQSEDIAAFADFQGNEVRQAIADARAGLAADPDLTIPQAAGTEYPHRRVLSSCKYLTYDRQDAQHGSRRDDCSPPTRGCG